ncbi:hypothetical protein AB0H76_05970 [Nocardia sp. NPDC050712]
MTTLAHNAHTSAQLVNSQPFAWFSRIARLFGAAGTAVAFHRW